MISCSAQSVYLSTGLWLTLGSPWSYVETRSARAHRVRWEVRQVGAVSVVYRLPRLQHTPSPSSQKSSAVYSIGSLLRMSVEYRVRSCGIVEERGADDIPISLLTATTVNDLSSHCTFITGLNHRQTCLVASFSRLERKKLLSGQVGRDDWARVCPTALSIQQSNKGN